MGIESKIHLSDDIENAIKDAVFNPKPERDIEKENQESCEHIYGFIVYDIETAGLVYDKDELKEKLCDYVEAFTYCPKCGKKLNDED